MVTLGNMGNYNLKEYREAKTIKPHLDKMLRLINLSIRGLSLYKSYLPVVKILRVMEEQKTLLDLHNKRYEEVLKNRGKIN